ncbi:vinorine synthase-like [Tasmannia lanceolata]|uniref:vinorine synthase-like n=1 Tax=Tasmannia lanceolata TaxID=3420 RepID=UPI0040637727
MITFINSWAAKARGASEVMGPSFDAASLFPSKLSVPRYVFAVGKNVVIRRFAFDALKIASLRDRIAKGQPFPRPTSYEAVSSLIWQCVIRAQRAVGSPGAYVALSAVNKRKRMVPPLPEHSFGNLWVPVYTSVMLESESHEEDMQSCLERQLRDSIKKVNTDLVKELQGPDGSVKAHESISGLVEKYSKYGLRFCNITSWSRFPIYEADFGWGKPIWVSMCPLPSKDSIFLLGNRSSDGIEAWVRMDKEEMAIIEQDEELLSFLSPPNIA